MAGPSAWQIEMLVASQHVRQLYYAIRNSAARQKQKPPQVPQWLEKLDQLHREMQESGDFMPLSVEEYMRAKSSK